MKLFEPIGDKLGLPLRLSEREEYALIEREALNSRYSPIPDKLHDRLKNTAKAYRLIRAMQKALVHAQKHEYMHAQWLEALRWAQEADKLLYALAETKFRKMVSLDTSFDWGTSTNVFLCGWLAIPLLSWYVSGFNMSQEEKMRLCLCYLVLVSAPAIIGVTLESNRTELTHLLLRSQVAYVLCAAKQSNLTLDPVQIPEQPVMIDESKQLTYEDRLEKIKFCKVPPSRYLCEISHQIMKRPTYGPHNAVHYDEESICRWLDINNSDPTTKQVLYISDLIFNHDLQREIESWVANKEKKFAFKTQKYNALFGSKSLIVHSMFTNKSLDDDDIDDEMMLHSAFGQGSTTYQAAKRGYG